MKKLTVEDVIYMQEKVIEWNKTFGNSIDDKSLIPTYHKLVQEEFFGEGEYLDSYNKGDMEGRLDGLIDSIFVGFFWAALEGYDFKREESYLYKTLSDQSREDINFTIQVIESYIKHDRGCYTYWVWFIELLALEQEHFDIIGAFNRVLESNYSKAMKLPDHTTIEKEVALIESQGRYGDVFTEQCGDYMIFRAKKDLKEGSEFLKGKIVKPSTFRSVEDLGGLKEFIYEGI